MSAERTQPSRCIGTFGSMLTKVVSMSRTSGIQQLALDYGENIAADRKPFVGAEMARHAGLAFYRCPPDLRDPPSDACRWWGKARGVADDYCSYHSSDMLIVLASPEWVSVPFARALWRQLVKTVKAESWHDLFHRPFTVDEMHSLLTESAAHVLSQRPVVMSDMDLIERALSHEHPALRAWATKMLVLRRMSDRDLIDEFLDAGDEADRRWADKEMSRRDAESLVSS